MIPTKRWLVRCLPLAALAALGLILAACGDGGKEEDGGPLPAAEDVLADAVERVETMETFHFRLEHENGASRIPLELDLTTAEGDVIVPDRMWAKLKAKAGTQPVEVEVIGIGDDGWITNPFTREWQPLPSGTTINDVFDPTQGIEAVVNALENAEVTAEENVGGVVTYRLEGTIDSAMLEGAAPIAEPGLTVGVKVWLGKDDSLIRRIRLEGPIAPDEPEDIVRKLDVSQFDEPVSIERPA
jgi:lipoprotein LprG